MTNLEIQSANNIETAAAKLHDARFFADDISFDKTAGTFAIKCWVGKRDKKDKGSLDLDGPSIIFQARGR